jgi:1,4-dihydroxy-2-naphthoate octaprenyltransferase
MVGTAVAHHTDQFRPAAALAALVGAMLLQVGSNFANDVFDFEKGADTEERLGPTRAVQSGLLSPQAVRLGMYTVFALATLVGVYLTALAGPVVVAIGVSSILAAVAYTAGPYPLGYHGLGDLFVMIFFGFVAVCGTVFVQAESVPTLAWWAALPVGSLATAILVVNNVRDRKTDRIANKKTLVARFGRRAGSIEYVALMLVAYGVPVSLVGAGVLGPFGALPIVTLPLAAGVTRRLLRDEGRLLNLALIKTAQLLLLFGLLLALGIFMDRALGP